MESPATEHPSAAPPRRPRTLWAWLLALLGVPLALWGALVLVLWIGGWTLDLDDTLFGVMAIASAPITLFAGLRLRVRGGELGALLVASAAASLGLPILAAFAYAACGGAVDFQYSS